MLSVLCPYQEERSSWKNKTGDIEESGIIYRAIELFQHLEYACSIFASKDLNLEYKKGIIHEMSLFCHDLVSARRHISHN